MVLNVTMAPSTQIKSLRVIFEGQNIRVSAIFRQLVVNIFVIAACTAGKVA